VRHLDVAKHPDRNAIGTQSAVMCQSHFSALGAKTAAISRAYAVVLQDTDSGAWYAAAVYPLAIVTGAWQSSFAIVTRAWPSRVLLCILCHFVLKLEF
jgi:hypothetical protein